MTPDEELEFLKRLATQRGYLFVEEVQGAIRVVKMIRADGTVAAIMRKELDHGQNETQSDAHVDPQPEAITTGGDGAPPRGEKDGAVRRHVPTRR